jgi:hypothetical protein
MRWLADLRRREPLLVNAAVANLAGVLLCAALFFIDQQAILGINRWIKPAKFFISLAIYLFTLAWLFSLLDRPVRWLRGLIVTSMAVEMICIFGQAVRGKRSHFNEETVLDLILFNTMGMFIALNTVCVFLLMVIFWRRRPPLDPALLWGVRLGLLVFIAGSLEAGFMLAIQAHTVGAADGSTGLPFVNWSRQHGDLRIAHFLGLHALQAFPIAALLLRRVGAVFAFAVVYVGAIVWLLLAALAGRPLL